VPGGWPVKVVLTDRRIVFEGATWQVRLSNVESIRSLGRDSSWPRILLTVIVGGLLALIPVVGPELAGGVGFPPPPTNVRFQLKDGRTITVSFRRKKDARRVVAAIEASKPR
jgi:hypothetical protein